MAKQAPDTDKGHDTVQDQTRFQHVSFIHVMGRDERWSRLGSVLYIVSI